MRPAAILLAVSLSVTAMAQQPTTLQALHDRVRPLLIFASADDPLVGQQLAQLRTHSDALRERDMQVFIIPSRHDSAHDGSQLPIGSLTPQQEQQARQRFHVLPAEFTIVLAGKDGGEKLRSASPLSWQRLSSTVDSMPMRKDEMRQR